MRDRVAQWFGSLGALFILALILLGVGISLLVTDAAPVVLSWETASEVGTAGFNVYRSPAWETVSGKGVQVNAALIPSKGEETVGASYRLEDKDAGLIPGRRYRYQIEEVEWDGSAMLYPETVTVRAGLSGRWTRAEGVGLILLGVVLVLSRLRRSSPSGIGE